MRHCSRLTTLNVGRRLCPEIEDQGIFGDISGKFSASTRISAVGIAFPGPVLATLRLLRAAASYSAAALLADCGEPIHPPRRTVSLRSEARVPPPNQIGRSPGLGRSAIEYPTMTSVVFFA